MSSASPFGNYEFVAPSSSKYALVGYAEPGGLAWELHQELVAERRECLVVERDALLEVGDGDADVIDHGRLIPSWME